VTCFSSEHWLQLPRSCGYDGAVCTPIVITHEVTPAICGARRDAGPCVSCGHERAVPDRSEKCMDFYAHCSGSGLAGTRELYEEDRFGSFLTRPIQNRKQRKLTKNIPDDKYHKGCRDVEVVDLADLRHEYTLVSSRLELIGRQPDLLAASRK
jgi:hypothetical protein